MWRASTGCRERWFVIGIYRWCVGYVLLYTLALVQSGRTLYGYAVREMLCNVGTNIFAA
jgi:hypothetical protein